MERGKNLGEMMEELENGRINSPDFAEQSLELKNHFQNQRLQEFIRVFAAINNESIKGNINLFKQAELTAGLLNIVKQEQIDEPNLVLLFEIIRRTMSNTQKTLDKYLRTEDYSKLNIYQSYLNEEFKLPSYAEMIIAQGKGYTKLIIHPGQLTENGPFVGGIDRDLRQHECNLRIKEKPGDVEIEEDERPNQFYAFMMEDLAAAQDGPMEMKQFILNFDQMRDMLKSHDYVMLSINQKRRDNLKLRGLTLNEYLFMQMCHSVEYAKDEKAETPNYLDTTREDTALLLGSKLISGDKNVGYLGANFNSTNKHLIISFDLEGKVGGFKPWVALSFDGKGGEGE